MMRNNWLIWTGSLLVGFLLIGIVPACGDDDTAQTDVGSSDQADSADGMDMGEDVDVGEDMDEEGDLDADEPDQTEPDDLPPAADSLCSPDGWCWEHPLPQGNWLFDYAITSPTDIWAVGQSSTILHWDGVEWTRFLPPGQDTVAEFHAIVVNANDDIWVGGSLGTAELYHWNGEEWTAVDDVAELANSVYDLWSNGQGGVWGVTDANDVFLVDELHEVTAIDVDAEYLNGIGGSGPEDVYAFGSFYVGHYSGGELNLTSETVSPDKAISSIWTSGPENVWLGGMGVFNGTTGSWTEIETDVNVVSISGSGPSDVWGAGYLADFGDQGISIDGYLGHWDGDTWAEVEVPSNHPLWRVASVGLDEIVTCANPSMNLISHWDGEDWNALTSNLFPSYASYWIYGHQWTNQLGLYDVVGFAADDIWVSGDVFDFVEHSTNGVIGHWDGDEWSIDVTIMDYSTITALHGQSSSELWAVARTGSGGDTVSAAYHRQESGWIEEAFPEGVVTIHDIWVSSTDSIWAVGDQGVVLHRDAEGWSLVEGLDATPETTFTDIWGYEDQIWIVGEDYLPPTDGILLHWNGSEWTQTTTSEAPTAIWGAGPDFLWAPGYNRPLVFTGDDWSEIEDAPVAHSMLAVCGSSADSIWMVGEGTNSLGALHYDGHEWTRQDVGTVNILVDCWVDPDGDVLAVGEAGMILRRQ